MKDLLNRSIEPGESGLAKLNRTQKIWKPSEFKAQALILAGSLITGHFLAMYSYSSFSAAIVLSAAYPGALLFCSLYVFALTQLIYQLIKYTRRTYPYIIYPIQHLIWAYVVPIVLPFFTWPVLRNYSPIVNNELLTVMDFLQLSLLLSILINAGIQLFFYLQLQFVHDNANRWHGLLFSASELPEESRAGTVIQVGKPALIVCMDNDQTKVFDINGAPVAWSTPFSKSLNKLPKGYFQINDNWIISSENVVQVTWEGYMGVFSFSLYNYPYELYIEKRRRHKFMKWCLSMGIELDFTDQQLPDLTERIWTSSEFKAQLLILSGAALAGYILSLVFNFTEAFFFNALLSAAIIEMAYLLEKKGYRDEPIYVYGQRPTYFRNGIALVVSLGLGSLMFDEIFLMLNNQKYGYLDSFIAVGLLTLMAMLIVKALFVIQFRLAPDYANAIFNRPHNSVDDLKIKDDPITNPGRLPAVIMELMGQIHAYNLAGKLVPWNSTINDSMERLPSSYFRVSRYCIISSATVKDVVWDPMSRFCISSGFVVTTHTLYNEVLVEQYRSQKFKRWCRDMGFEIDYGENWLNALNGSSRKACDTVSIIG